MTCLRWLPISIHSLPGLMKSSSVAFEVERVAHLVEVGDLQVGALAHLAAVGRELAEDQLEQRGLAGAVGADQADLVAAQDGGA